jgi:hypothetical protein
LSLLSGVSRRRAHGLADWLLGDASGALSSFRLLAGRAVASALDPGWRSQGASAEHCRSAEFAWSENLVIPALRRDMRRSASASGRDDAAATTALTVRHTHHTGPFHFEFITRSVLNAQLLSRSPPCRRSASPQSSVSGSRSLRA